MRILFYTNPSYGPYGYSIVAKYVVEGLRKAGHDVMIIGNITAGRPIEDEKGNINFPAGLAPWGNDVMENYLKGYDIELMVSILDTWMPEIQYLPELTKKFNIPLITHATIRGYPLSPMMCNFLMKSDHIIVPSKFAYATAAELAEIKHKLSFIPHGVDLDVYKPIPGMREAMKKRLGYDDKFCFLGVGRNNFFMKRFDIMFKAYKILMDNEPETRKNTILHLHTLPSESLKLDILRDRGGMQQFIRFSKLRPKQKRDEIELCNENDPNAMMNNPNFGMREDEMAKMYNMTDCHISTTGGESFCLPVVESEACGIPQIFPDNTTGPELIGNVKAGLLAGIQAEMTTPLITDEKYADPLLVAKCMQHMYAKGDDRKTFSENAIMNAQKYSWKNIIPMWISLVERIGQGKKVNVDYTKGDLGV